MKSKTEEPFEEKFAAIILSHGRSDNVATYKTLRNYGYTGRIIIVIDDKDTQADDYIARYGKDDVVIFDKDAVSKTFDNLNNFNNKNVVVHARNATFEIAKNLGLTSFVQLDDDYKNFYFMFDSDLNICRTNATGKIDRVFAEMVKLLRTTGALSVAMMQGGDFIGGLENKNVDKPKLKRKVMNSFFCLTERPFQFIGTMNEDVNTYTLNGMRGKLFLSTNMVMLIQVQTQAAAGGMTDIYNSSGTYIKSFYTVMICPSSTRISHLGHGPGRRIHHQTKWKYAVPKILSESLRKQ